MRNNVHATFITDIQGPNLTELEKQMLTSPFLGGVILFTRHFESTAQLKALTQQIMEINSDLLITVDHEGGRVQRFRQGFTKIPAMGKLGALHASDNSKAKKAASDCAIVLACELLDAGIHLTYAPVLDINYGRNQVIADRSFSVNPNVICELAESFMQGLKDMDFAVVGKHFPGHGWVSLDSHVACPVDEREYQEIEQSDLKPFKKLMPLIDWMMPAHVVYTKVDAEPAGFSKIWLQDILRGQFKFNGRIVSDDLSMAGAAVKGGYWPRAKAAMEAGCDILLACNSSDASMEILAGMEAQGVQPKSLAPYKPQSPSGDILESQCYLQAIQRLTELELIT